MLILAPSSCLTFSSRSSEERKPWCGWIQSRCNGCQQPTVIRGESKFWWRCPEPICVRSVPKFQGFPSLWVFAGLYGCWINKTNTVACSHDGHDAAAAAAARSAMKSALGCKTPPFTLKDTSKNKKWTDSCSSGTTDALRRIRRLTKSSLDCKCDVSKTEWMSIYSLWFLRGLRMSVEE